MNTKLKDALLDILEMEDVEFQQLEVTEDLRNYSFTSLNAIELIVEIEDILGVQVDNEDLLVEKLSTIEKIEEIYSKYLRKGGEVYEE